MKRLCESHVLSIGSTTLLLAAALNTVACVRTDMSEVMNREQSPNIAPVQPTTPAMPADSHRGECFDRNSATIDDCDPHNEQRLPGVFYAHFGYHESVYQLQVVQCRSDRNRQVRQVASWSHLCREEDGTAMEYRIPVYMAPTDLFPQFDVERNPENGRGSQMCFALTTADDMVRYVTSDGVWHYRELAQNPPDWITIPTTTATNSQRRVCLRLPVVGIAGASR